MLKRLEIRNLALLKAADLEFEAGLNLITGETGAGKSILLDALGLLLGFRAGQELVRTGTEAAQVQGQFEIEKAQRKALNAWLESKGLAAEEGELWLKRELNRQGRSRVWINGTSVPLAALVELGEMLADFQGQHEHQALLKNKFHRQYLDDFSGLEASLGALSLAFEAVQEARQRLKEGSLSEEERLKRIDMLLFQVKELEAAAPKLGERQELLRQRDLAQHAERRREALRLASGSLEGEESGGALEELATLEQQMARLKEWDPSWGEALERLRAAQVEIRDLAQRVENEIENFDQGQQAAETIESRLHLLEQLGRKYGQDEEAMLEFLDAAKRQLLEMEDHQAHEGELKHAYQKARQGYGSLASELSQKRRQNAKKLEKGVAAELAALGMPHAKFEVRLQTKVDADGIGNRWGTDEIEFLLSANPGEEPKELAKVASGGELSRISLALKSALARDSGQETLIFDEVDTGISGRVAEIVGQKLAALAKRQQLLCVTHLPQIASLPGRHYRVQKRSEKDETWTETTLLDREGREQEIAGMLSGQAVSESALHHARELLSAAQK
jgi:DNA repair protein RecN (Recombination protein N)